MDSEISWAEPPMAHHRDGRGPDFPDDDRFNPVWWRRTANFGPPEHQWRSYIRGGEEVARMLLSFRYATHSRESTTPAVLIWDFEVREGLRISEDRIGTRIITQLAEEFSDRELYIGPTSDAVGFWKRFGWPMCDCDRCEGRDMIVRRP